MVIVKVLYKISKDGQKQLGYLANVWYAEGHSSPSPSHYVTCWMAVLKEAQHESQLVQMLKPFGPTGSNESHGCVCGWVRGVSSSLVLWGTQAAWHQCVVWRALFVSSHQLVFVWSSCVQFLCLRRDWWLRTATKGPFDLSNSQDLIYLKPIVADCHHWFTLILNLLECIFVEQKEYIFIFMEVCSI